ncbi:MAG TPA: hypothetical protein VMY37_04260, partial [Thermoguttaceae bacterium]|nr:hypothetical protein [Thermoguttaceae bacterium]
MSRAIKGGSTSVSTVIRFVDSTTGIPEEGVVAATAGLAIWYRREGAVKVDLGALNDLATLDAAWNDKGILHIDDGYYRLDVADAAFAAGVGGVLIGGTATGMVAIAAYHPIDEPADAIAISGDKTAADNLESACDNYSATRGLTGTALPAVAGGANGGVPLVGSQVPNANADAAGGLPTTTKVTDARLGALTDWIDGGRLDLLLDAIPTTAMRGTDGAN